MNQRLNEEKPAFHPDHSRISPTAKLVAWWRTFSDIPYAKQVSELSDAYQAVRDMLDPMGVDPAQTLWGAPLLEIRYKSLMREIKSSGYKQVLELASGIALRGLAMTADPACAYVETDLPGITREKLKIVEAITGKAANEVRANLHFVEANVLNMKELDAATAKLDPDKPVVIVHEGLLQYFSRAEKIQATRNIKAILRRFGGIWITPDFDFRETVAEWGKVGSDAAGKMLEAIAQATGRAMLSEAFENEKEFLAFLASEGLEGERVRQCDADMKVSSEKTSGITPDIMRTLAQGLHLWKIRAL